ncbi:ferredoxin family protein [Chloroflexota bacterium]
MSLIIEKDDKRCNRCTICVDACPIPCYVFDEKENIVRIIDEDQCIVCRNCEEECPTSCIDIILE